MSAVLGQGPNSSSRDTYNNIFVLFCRTKTPDRWKMLTTDEAIFIPERRSQFDNLENRRSSLDDQMRPDLAPSDSFRQLHPWTIAMKLLTKSLWVETHSFEDISPLCPPLPGKAIKLFFFFFRLHLFSASEIWLGKGAEAKIHHHKHQSKQSRVCLCWEIANQGQCMF